MTTKKEKFKPIDIKSFHAKTHAKSQRKKRSPDARAVYDMIVTLGSELYEGGFFHPKMTPISLPPRHFETIAHNIGRVVADEVTAEQKKYKAETKTKPTKKTLLKKK